MFLGLNSNRLKVIFMGFGSERQVVYKKTVKTAKVLTSILSNINKLRKNKKRFFTIAVQSKILYKLTNRV